MRLVVIGGTGLIGPRLVTTLRTLGHDVATVSAGSGTDTLTGDGLAEVLRRAAVVIDVSDSPSLEDEAVMPLVTTSTRLLLRHEVAAGVAHHVALSSVGTDSLLESGYFRARSAQERLIKDAPIPYPSFAQAERRVGGHPALAPHELVHAHGGHPQRLGRRGLGHLERLQELLQEVRSCRSPKTISRALSS